MEVHKCCIIFFNADVNCLIGYIIRNICNQDGEIGDFYVWDAFYSHWSIAKQTRCYMLAKYKVANKSRHDDSAYGIFCHKNKRRSSRAYERGVQGVYRTQA